MISRLIKFVLLFAVIGIIAYGLKPSPMLVELSEVKHAPLTITVDEEGKTRVIDRFIISAPVSGYLRRIKLDVGDNIEENQIIAELEPLKSDILDPRARAQAQARVKAAQSALKVAEENVDATKADMDYAQAEFDRKEKLRNARTISQEELDLAYANLRRIKANFRSAEFAVEVSKFELDVAKTALAQYNVDGAKPQELVYVKAPVKGQVLKISRESEGAINVSEPILEIGNPRALEVEVDVLSIDAIKIKPGTKVTFLHWGGDASLEGVVRLIEPVGFTKVSALGVEEQRVLVIADIISPPKQWERLGDGYRVEANFVIWQQDNVLQIPASSLFRANNRWAVYALVDSMTELRYVEVGKTNGLQTQIISGLDQNEFVVTFPESQLKPGTKIQART